MATSQRLFPEPVDAVVVASSQTYPDSIGGATLAGLAGGSLLLVEPTVLPDTVRAEVDHVLAGGGTLYLFGGERAISPGVGDQVVALS